MTGIRRSLLALSFAAAAIAACAPTEHAEQASKPAGEAAGAVAADTMGARGTTAATTSASSAASAAAASPASPAPRSGAQITSEPVRALYVNRWASQSRRRMAKLIAAADSTEINAFVIDMKDEFGLNYKSQNPEFAKNAGSATTANVKALLDTLKAHKILPIARLVVFKDSVTARIHPEWTIRRKDNSIWRDKKGIAWVNPYHRELWEYNIGVAEELVKLGFGEVQFDYIRFPEPYPSLPQQVFPDANGVSKQDALAGYLKEAKSRLNKLGVRSTADIFGLVTTVGGPLEVGQEWEKISPYVDVVLPMVYPSHYPRGSLGVANPNAQPYDIIFKAISRARERDAKLGITTPEHIRPWLQAFTLGKPAYGAEQLEAQKKAVYDAGYDGWVMWNPGSIYDVFMPGLEKTFVSRKKGN
ncbi:MAG: putative glycoside hydrolase [Gemmatimonadaceae bacterium]